MKTWVISANEDETELGLLLKEHWEEEPRLRVDTTDRPLTIRKEFEADSFEEAKKAYNDFWGFT